MSITLGNMKLYDVQELSEMFNIQDRTVRKLLRDGAITGKKLARKWYVSEDALKEYFKSGPLDIHWPVSNKS